MRGKEKIKLDTDQDTSQEVEELRACHHDHRTERTTRRDSLAYRCREAASD